MKRWIRKLLPPEETKASATVKHKTKKSKGCLGRETAFIMVSKLIKNDEKTWQSLEGKDQLPKIILGVKFSDDLKIIVSNKKIAFDIFKTSANDSSCFLGNKTI